MAGRTIGAVLTGLAALAGIILLVASAVVYQQDHPAEAPHVFALTAFIVAAIVGAALIVAGIIIRPAAALRIIGYVLGGAIILALLTGGVAFAWSALKGTHSASTSTASSFTPSPTVVPPGGIIYQSPLAPASGNWANDQYCFPRAEGYHVKNAICDVPAAAQADVDVVVQVTQASGAVGQPYGVAVRVKTNQNSWQGYLFVIASNQVWAVLRCGYAKCESLSEWTFSSAINAGLHADNTLEVRTVGAHFEFLINGHEVGQVDDATFSTGSVGLFADADEECIFTNLTMSRPF